MTNTKQKTPRDAARKTLILQVLLLTAITVIISLASRMYGKNRFETTLIVSSNNKTYELSDLQLEWEGEPIPVLDSFVTHETDDSVTATALHLKMQPEKAGEYPLRVLDKEGNELANDLFRVDASHTAFSASTGNFTGDEGLHAAVIFFYIGLTAIMLVFFITLKGSLIYTYEAILSFGVFVFSFLVLITAVPAFIRHLQSPEFYPTWALLTDVASGGKYFVFYTSPLFAAFSVLLIISNIALLRNERPRLQNVLGLLLGLCMIGGIAFYLFFTNSGFSGSSEEFQIRVTVENLIGIVIAYMECILISSVVCGLRAAKHVPSMDRDYILILGCGFRKDGTLPPLLKGRVDKAIEFWRTQKERSGKTAVVIPSGGKGYDESMTESQAMYNYMVSHGFPEESIVRETRSENTYQNMEFSKAIIERESAGRADVKTAYVTTNYHVFRSGVWAGLAGLEAEGVGSRTKWWFWPNAFIRECLGLLKNRLLPEILFLAVLIAVFGIFTFLSFQ